MFVLGYSLANLVAYNLFLMGLLLSLGPCPASSSGDVSLLAAALDAFLCLALRGGALGANRFGSAPAGSGSPRG